MPDAVADMPQPRLVIRPPRSWLPANPREVWEFRGLLTRFAARDLTLRYRQTLLGMIWVVLQPLVGAGVLSFVFGTVAGLKGPSGVPYFVFTFAGMTAWNLYSVLATRSSVSLVGNAHLVQKVFFPRLLLPLSSLLSTLVDLTVSLVVLVVLLVISGVWAGFSFVLLPVWLVLVSLSGLGFGMTAGALAVRYRDVQYVMPVAVQFLLFASPIAFSLSSTPPDSRWFVLANPLSGLLEAVRWSTIGTDFPPAGLLVYAALANLAVFVLGVIVFSRLERQFADVI